MLAKEMWDTLSGIDVSKHTEKEGKFTYLSWSWAWSEFSKHYPDCDYELSDRTFSDETMEVYCKMEAFGGGAERAVKRNMWLPVLNHQNKPIKNPTSFDVNTAKMRCLVKCLAMYGLGLYIYAGEDLPEAPEPADIDVTDWVTLINDSDSLSSLKENYTDAYNAVKSNKKAVAAITKAKDAKKGGLA